MIIYISVYAHGLRYVNDGSGCGVTAEHPTWPTSPSLSSHNNIDFAMQMDMLRCPSFFSSLVSSFLLSRLRECAARFVLIPDEPFFCQECTLGILPSFQMLIPRGYGLVLWELALWCKAGRKWLLCALLFKVELRWIYNSSHILGELIHDKKWKVSLVRYSESC
jgi:hypothetical protein